MLDKPVKLGAGTSAASTSLLAENIGALQALGAPHEPRTLTYGLWRAFGRDFLAALLPTLSNLGYTLAILTILRYAAMVIEIRDGWPIQTGLESAAALTALGGAGCTTACSASCGAVIRLPITMNEWRIANGSRAAISAAIPGEYVKPRSMPGTKQ